MTASPGPRSPAGTATAERSLQKASSSRSRVSIFLLLLGAAVAIDALLIEPNWIEVTRHHIYVQAPAGALARPLKIAHLSDLHTRGMGRRERRLLALLEAEQPDLVVVTGDTLANYGNYEVDHQVLSRLHAPLGVWVVRGNWENWRPVKNERAFYASAGVNFLLNEARLVCEGMWIVGLDDPSSGSPDLESALKGVPPGAYTLTLFHSPAYFDQIAARCPLVLAGHTHGGQVRIPLLPTFWLPRGSGRFLAGWYRRGGAQMYVSRGIGTSILPVRFLCRPELAIITVER